MNIKELKPRLTLEEALYPLNMNYYMGFSDWRIEQENLDSPRYVAAYDRQGMLRMTEDQALAVAEDILSWDE